MLGIKKAHLKSVTAKLLLFLLMISFALWGVGDIIRGPSDPVVISIGSKKIHLSRWLNIVNTQAKEYGLNPNDKKLRQEISGAIIQDELFKMAANDAILVGQDMVKLKIASTPTFFDAQNKFDRNKFDMMLRNNRITEKQFADTIKNDISRGLYQTPFTLNLSMPQKISTVILASRALKKNGKIYTINSQNVKLERTPTDDELQAILEQHKHLFLIPEKREVSYLTISTNNINTPNPSEAELREYFDLNSMQFATDAKRSFYQVILSSSEEAQKVYQEITTQNITDLKAYAEKHSLKFFDNKDISRRMLLPNLQEPIFALQQNEISQPIMSPLGWLIIQVKDIHPFVTPDFAAKKDDVKKLYIADKQAENLIALASAIEEDIAADTNINEIAQKYGLKVNTSTITGFPENLAKDIPSTVEFINTALSLAEGEQSVLIESSFDDVNYFTVKADKISPATQKQLIDVRAELVEIWKKQEKAKLAHKILEDLIDKLMLSKNDQEMIQRFVKDNNIETQHFSLNYYDNSNDIPEVTKRTIKLMEPNITISSPITDNNGNVYVISTDNLSAGTITDIEEVKNEIHKEILNDNFQIFMTQLLQYLHAKYNTDIDEKLIDYEI